MLKTELEPGIRERGSWNGERGSGNWELGSGNGELETGNGKLGTENWERATGKQEAGTVNNTNTNNKDRLFYYQSEQSY